MGRSYLHVLQKLQELLVYTMLVGGGVSYRGMCRVITSMGLVSSLSVVVVEG